MARPIYINIQQQCQMRLPRKWGRSPNSQGDHEVVLKALNYLPPNKISHHSFAQPFHSSRGVGEKSTEVGEFRRWKGQAIYKPASDSTNSLRFHFGNDAAKRI